MRLEHANLTVQDVDRSTAFYRAVLGFEVRWQGSARDFDGPVRAVHIGTDDTYLALFESQKEGRAPADYDAPGLNHIGFQVDSVDTYRARLAELDIEVHLEGDYDPGRRIYFYDPDGIEVELVEY